MPQNQAGVSFKRMDLLMRSVFEDMRDLKHALQGDSLSSIDMEFVAKYKNWDHAKTTNPNHRDKGFDAYADFWVKRMEEMQVAPTLDNYKATVNSCIQCHQAYCPGPLVRIKKLTL